MRFDGGLSGGEFVNDASDVFNHGIKENFEFGVYWGQRYENKVKSEE
jgi:hypothetical protein